jgi:hypothetical protein
MANRKDSRFRTVQREYGKVFVVWFGGIYTHNKEGQSNSLFKIGENVELVEGSTSQEVILRSPRRPEIGTEVWKFSGVQGGEKSRDKFEKEWKKFLAGEKSVAPAKAFKELELENRPDHIGNWDKYTQEERDAILPHIEKILVVPVAAEHRPKIIGRPVTTREPHTLTEVFALSADHESSSCDIGVVVRFQNSDNASSFRMAVTRRGWKTEELQDPNTGETAVFVRSK